MSDILQRTLYRQRKQGRVSKPGSWDLTHLLTAKVAVCGFVQWNCCFIGTPAGEAVFAGPLLIAGNLAADEAWAVIA